MSNSIDAARMGMIEHERNLEAIANNLANANTTGYKRVAVHFQDLLSTEDALNVLFEGGEVPAPSAGVQLDSVSRVMEPGTLMQVDDPLALAIVGNGFFAVRVDADTVAYTRDGTFSLDAEGFLVTTNGYRLEPPIQIEGLPTEFNVTRDGQILVRTAGTEELQEMGVFQLAVFPEPGALISGSQNLFLETPESGAPVMVTAGQDGAGEVFSRTLEASNVDMALEMTNMIAAQRAYQFNLVAFQTASEMMQQLNQATQV